MKMKTKKPRLIINHMKFAKPTDIGFGVPIRTVATALVKGKEVERLAWKQYLTIEDEQKITKYLQGKHGGQAARNN